MDSLEFECPSCNGLFNAAVTDVEVACPHCDEKMCRDDLNADSTSNVTLVAKAITMPAPLFPPGYKRPAANDSSTPVTEDFPSIVIIDDDVKKSVDDTKPVTPTPVPEDFPPIVIIDDDVKKSDDDTKPVISTTVAEDVPSIVIIHDDVKKSDDDTKPVIPTTVAEDVPSIVIIDDDVKKSYDDTKPVTPTPVAEDCPSVVIIDDDVKKSVDDTKPVTPTPVAEDCLPIVIIDDDVDESLDSNENDIAIDDLLPPDFHLDDVQIETRTGDHQTTEAAVIINVRVDAEPATVGRGINKRELRSRTPDEKTQFMRNKNVIVWVIGVSTIIVTMILMLQFA